MQLELTNMRSMQESFPIFIKRCRVPKRWEAHTELGMGVPKTKDNGFYSEEDLIVGETMNLYGRRCLITGADRSTRKYYKEKYGLTFPVRG